MLVRVTQVGSLPTVGLTADLTGLAPNLHAEPGHRCLLFNRNRERSSKLLKALKLRPITTVEHRCVHLFLETAATRNQ